MKHLIAAMIACLTVGAPIAVSAENPPTNTRSIQDWKAVGRLNINNKTMCTGALIAPDLVLTAAHCLYDPSSGRRVDPTSIRFEAGLSGRQAAALRQVVRAVMHPQYQYRPEGTHQIGSDLAVLKLSHPISSQYVRPLTLSSGAARGDVLGVMSYTAQHATQPKLQRSCSVLARQSRTLVMSCLVDFGASGSPVLEMRPGQPPRLVSVIAAKAAMGRRKVSIGTAFDASLRALMQRAG